MRCANHGCQGYKSSRNIVPWAFLNAVVQHRAPAPEPGLSHAAADPPGRPMDIWTIGVADRRASPASRASSESRGMLAFAHIPIATGEVLERRMECNLKPFEVTQRVRHPPGRGAARQPEAS